MVEKNIIFKTKRLEIRKFKLKYITKDYFEWFNDHSVKKFIQFKPKNFSELKKNIKKNIKDKNNLFCGIFYNKIHIGNIKFHNINIKKKEAWIGILIGKKEFRSAGYATEVICEALNFLSKKNFLYTFLNVDRRNRPAIKLYKKCGFKEYKKYKKYITMRSNIFEKKIILGTAQLNSNYGVTNTLDNYLDNSKTLKILKSIHNTYIQEIDTAVNYPFKNKLIKEVKKKVFINTKILTSDVNKINKILNKIKKTYVFKNTLINTIFIHDGWNISSKNGQNLINKLDKLKKLKIIKKIGISCHDANDLQTIIKKPQYDIIQLPYSVVDQRCTKYLKKIKKNNIEIHARSIFLQGALLQKVKTNFYLSKIYDKIKLIGKKRLSFLLSFVLNNNNIDKVIIGVRNKSQLEEILNFTYKIPNQRFCNSLKTKNEKIINPLKWKELKYHER